MKRLLLALCILALLATPVAATRNTFQDWGYSGISFPTGIFFPAGSDGNNYMYSGLVGGSLTNTNPSAMTYAAIDSSSANHAIDAYLYDSSGTQISVVYGPTISPDWHRQELKVIGGTPTMFLDGVQVDTGAVVLVNPSYIKWTSPYNTVYFDNVLYSESDHHVVGALPSNGTIIRDLIDPAVTGYYQWNPNTNAWVVKNNYYMYVIADTDSTDSTYTENLVITNTQYGTVINTTAIDSTVPRHQIKYNIADFLNTSTALGTTIPDGEYSVCFQGSAVCGNFWVISNGAAVSLDKTSYVVGESAIVSYTMLPAYFDTSTYTYTMKLLDAYGTVIESKAINSATGVDTFVLSTPGVRFIEVIATKNSDSSTYILGYASTTVYEYLQFSGHVYDGNTTLVLAGAAFNFTQGSTIVTGISGFDGNFTATGFGTGGVLTYNFTKSGYYPRNYSLIPITTGPKTLDVTLYSKTEPVTGSSILGTVTDSVYGSIIPMVTMYATNGTEVHSVVSNDKSFYVFDNNRGTGGPLVSGKCYQMNAVKTGYTFESPTGCQVAP
jgi:hypothetical protein